MPNPTDFPTRQQLKQSVMARDHVTFPTEIYDIIVGILAEEGDLKAVKVLARTCKSILPTCRSHIFATLDLVPPQNNSCDDTADTHSRRLENLRRVFISNPSLSSYVRKVDYMIRRVDDNYQDFHSVLQGLSRVKSLVLRGTIHDAGTYITSVDWLNISASLRLALTSILHTACLAELYLDHICNFPVTILASSRSLTHLTIDSAHFHDDVVSDNEISTSVLRLNALTFTEYSSGAIQTLMGAKAGNLSVVDFSRLIKLNSLDKTGHIVVTALLDVSTCLESITCTVWDTFNQPFCNILKPNTLKTLKTFSAIVVIPPWLGSMDVDPLYSLPDEFDKWATNNILERIDITIRVGQDVRFSTTASAWTRLNALTNQDHFPSLRAVSLTISLLKEESSTQNVKDDLDSQQHQIFKELHESNAVDFRLSVGLHGEDAY